MGMDNLGPYSMRRNNNRRALCPAIVIFRLATPMGFEPTISTVTGWHVNRYTTGPDTDFELATSAIPF
jgi:hypothetical protein